ncbi:2-oxoisovalerate dehydrogenase subunit alpha, mitochondrial [Manis javanica]|nr:2-oxoisovalerate dehydrogenase subunit alpha, mitochondrial [Manis javanica]
MQSMGLDQNLNIGKDTIIYGLYTFGESGPMEGSPAFSSPLKTLDFLKSADKIQDPKRENKHTQTSVEKEQYGKHVGGSAELDNTKNEVKKECS